MQAAKRLRHAVDQRPLDVKNVSFKSHCACSDAINVRAAGRFTDPSRNSPQAGSFVEPRVEFGVGQMHFNAGVIMAKKPKTLSDLFHDTLKDIYYAENKILKTLPKMAKAAQSKDLKAAFTKHERETRGQVARLDKVFKIIGKPARGKTCDAINGITDEGAEIMKEFKGAPALDAGLLASAQAVEHYEIARYGTLRTWAEELGHGDAAELLEATLAEEKMTDKNLTALAKSVINLEAEQEEA